MFFSNRMQSSHVIRIQKGDGFRRTPLGAVLVASYRQSEKNKLTHSYRLKVLFQRILDSSQSLLIAFKSLVPIWFDKNMACMIDSDISEHIKKAAIDVFIELTGYQFDIDIDEENDEICLEFDHSNGLRTVAVRFTSTNVVPVLQTDRSFKRENQKNVAIMKIEM